MVKNERGFTLVEVVASMTILFIILISFLGIFAQSAMFTRTNEDSLQATNLANRAMEVLRTSESVNKDELKVRLLEADLVNVGCQDIELISDGCQSEESLSIKIEILDPETHLELIPVRIDIFHEDRENALATRHFYVGE